MLHNLKCHFSIINSNGISVTWIEIKLLACCRWYESSCHTNVHLHGQSGQDGQKENAQKSSQLGGPTAGRGNGEDEGDGSTCSWTSSSCSQSQGVNLSNVWINGRGSDSEDTGRASIHKWRCIDSYNQITYIVKKTANPWLL